MLQSSIDPTIATDISRVGAPGMVPQVPVQQVQQQSLARPAVTMQAGNVNQPAGAYASPGQVRAKQLNMTADNTGLTMDQIEKNSMQNVDAMLEEGQRRARLEEDAALKASLARTYQGDPNAGPQGVGGDYLKTLAGIESGGDYNAYNKGSGARGKYQFIPSTEKAVAKKLGLTLDEARTPAGQEKMIRRFTEDNRQGLIKAGIQPTSENLWYAHNQGLGGAIALVKGGNVSARNIGSNLPQGGLATAENYKSQWANRFRNV